MSYLTMLQSMLKLFAKQLFVGIEEFDLSTHSQKNYANNQKMCRHIQNSCILIGLELKEQYIVFKNILLRRDPRR